MRGFLTHIFLLLGLVYFPVGLGSTVSLWQSSWVSSFCMRHAVACHHSEPRGPASLSVSSWVNSDNFVCHPAWRFPCSRRLALEPKGTLEISESLLTNIHIASACLNHAASVFLYVAQG